MSELTDALKELIGSNYIAVATVTAVQENGYAAKTLTGEHDILLSSQQEYAVGDNVFYEIYRLKITGKAPAKLWPDINI